MNHKEKIVGGQVVRSTAGRDAGRFFVALKVDNETGCAYIADGKVRSLARPKRKKLRHLAPTARNISVEIDATCTDKRLRSLLTENKTPNNAARQQGTGGNALVKE